MAAACGGLHQIFYSAPQPESPASSFMIDSSPWKNPNPNPNQPLDHSFTEIFGELHFQEPSPIFNISSSSSSSSSSWSSPSSSSSSPPPPPEAADSINDPEEAKERNNEDHPASGSSLFLGRRHRNSDSFSSMNTESRLLQMCTEGLGFESFDDVEDLKSEILSCGSNWDDKYCNLMDSSSSSSSSTPHAWARDQSVAVAAAVTGGGGGGDTVLDTGLDQYKRAKRRCAREFPPPISCIGRSTGKPCVWFESYRKDGRFVLRQVRIPAQQFLHARRENGRLRLCFVQPGGDQAHELDDDDDDEEEEEDDQGGDLENAAKNQEDIEDDEVNSTEVYI